MLLLKLLQKQAAKICGSKPQCFKVTGRNSNNRSIYRSTEKVKKGIKIKRENYRSPFKKEFILLCFNHHF
jgi:hypothetical protein